MLVTYHWKNLSLVLKMHFVYYKTSDHRNLEQKYNNVNYTSNMSKYICTYTGCGRVVEVEGHKAKRLVLQCFSSARSNPWRVNTYLSEHFWIKFADVFEKALYFIMNTNFLTGKDNFIIMYIVCFSQNYIQSVAFILSSSHLQVQSMLFHGRHHNLVDR